MIAPLHNSSFTKTGRHSRFKSFYGGSDHLILGGFRLISISTPEGETLYQEMSRGAETEIP